MSGIRVVILRHDFTLAKKKVRPNVSHIHYNNGSYLNRGNAILKTANKNAPPVLIFQEGNAIPKDAAPKNEIKISMDANNSQLAQHPLEAVKWETWYIPMLRGLNRQHHGRTNLNFGKLFNLGTLPFWIIGLAVLWQILSPIFFPASTPSPSPTPLP